MVYSLEQDRLKTFFQNSMAAVPKNLCADFVDNDNKVLWNT